MNRRWLGLSSAYVMAACGGAQPPAEPPVVVPSAAPPVASAAPPAPPPPSAPPKETEAEKAQQARAKADADHQKDLQRWTPELHASAQRLADASYPSLSAALNALLPSAHRQPGFADRDKYRHPRETLELFGVKPTGQVLEFGPGNGWYTELLAPALAKRGKLFVTSDDPNGPDGRAVGAYRLKLLFDTSPELFSKVEAVRVDTKNPKLALDGKLDTVLLIRELHGLVSEGTADAWLAEFKRALKPGGVLGIVDHRAPKDADPLKSAKLGYLPEAWTISQVEAAGFKLAGKSEVNANPKDTKDYAEGVWVLPPTYRLGDKDREKYAAIGESDRFTLRFVKK